MKKRQHEFLICIFIGVLCGMGLYLFGGSASYFSFPSDQITASRELGEQRLTSNVKDNGGFVYRYDPITDTTPNTNNDIRQLMASRLLAEMAAEDLSLRDLHQKNLAYVLRTMVKSSGDVLWIEHSGRSKLGGIAMGIRTLVASPYFDDYTDLAEGLAETILQMQGPDGSFRAWWIAPDYAYDEDYLLTFYSGEAILALLELFLKTDDTRRLDAAKAAQAFYLVRYVEQIDQWYYPAYVPRHTMSMYRLYEITEDEGYAQAVFFLNDKLIREMLHTDEQEPFYVGRFYNPTLPEYGSPHSSSDAVYTEGLAYAYDLASRIGDRKRQETYGGALELAVQNLIRLQYTSGDVADRPHGDKVIGAIRTNDENLAIRVDTTQHMIDAFRAIERFVK